jgi:hypothetical protein
MDRHYIIWSSRSQPVTRQPLLCCIPAAWDEEQDAPGDSATGALPPSPPPNLMIVYTSVHNDYSPMQILYSQWLSTGQLKGPQMMSCTL